MFSLPAFANVDICYAVVGTKLVLPIVFSCCHIKFLLAGYVVRLISANVTSTTCDARRPWSVDLFTPVNAVSPYCSVVLKPWS